MPLLVRNPFVVSAGIAVAMLDHDCRELLPSGNTQVAGLMI
jgi:hypothetical protein